MITLPEDLHAKIGGTSTTPGMGVLSELRTWGDVQYLRLKSGGNSTQVRVIGDNVHWGVAGIYTTPSPTKNYRDHQITAVAEVILANVQEWENPRPECADWRGKPQHPGTVTVGGIVYNG
jgi:hypothetical protein